MKAAKNTKQCPVPGCSFHLKANPLCFWHWYQTPTVIRNQVLRGMIPASFAVVMAVQIEKDHERQDKIDAAVKP